tara:strand:- start:2790 stop:3281 length:492 start_codon:yes stop_codon:yes gene_type:complete
MDGNDNKLEGIFTDHTQHITDENYNKPELITIDHKQQKIKDIFFGLPKNPIRWPTMKPLLSHPGGYFNITEALYDYAEMSKCGTVKIPSGYLGDRKRTKMIFEAYKKLYNFKGKHDDDAVSVLRHLPHSQHSMLYKEIFIKMEDGKEYYLSKWKGIKIINWTK